jgi:ribulose-phosphate 3-epimerase
MARDVSIAPSVLGADPLFVGTAVDALAGAYDWLHLDIMDGHFVRNFSFGPDMAKALHRRYPEAFLDVHLMLDNPDAFLSAFIRAGASQVTVHAEAEPQLLYGRLLKIREEGARAGVALAPATTVEQVRFALPVVDVVLVMSVTPGFGGQPLIESVLEKARDLVRLRSVENYRYLIEMDGGVKLENAALTAAAGVDVLVIGSALFGSSDPAEYLARTREEVHRNGVRGLRKSPCDEKGDIWQCPLPAEKKP